MGINIGKISNKVAAVQAVGDKLGIFNKKKKAKRDMTQSPRNKILEKQRTSQLSTLQFPEDIGIKYFFLKFKAYSYKSATSGAISGNSSDINEPSEKLQSHIVLPLPRELTEEYSVAYKDTQLGLAGTGLEALENGGMSSVDELKAQVMQTLTSGGAATKAGKGTAAVLGLSALQKTGGVGVKGAAKLAGMLGVGGAGVEGALNLKFGATQNPVERALLDGVPLRNHTFSFKMIPRNAREVTAINKIIHEIRLRMMPKPGQGIDEFFYDFPDIVEYGFKGTFASQPHKPGVITSLKVDYAPDGASFFMKSGEAVAYVLSLSIKEFEPINRDDFSKSVTSKASTESAG